jgi:4-diphosphocytidyl-2C-methyl-D-erythritol kinase
MTAAVTRSAPAKINLFLRVLAREDNGYHGIETLFCRLALADELVAERVAEPGVTQRRESPRGQQLEGYWEW